MPNFSQQVDTIGTSHVRAQYLDFISLPLTKKNQGLVLVLTLKDFYERNLGSSPPSNSFHPEALFLSGKFLSTWIKPALATVTGRSSIPTPTHATSERVSAKVFFTVHQSLQQVLSKRESMRMLCVQCAKTSLKAQESFQKDVWYQFSGSFFLLVMMLGMAFLFGF